MLEHFFLLLYQVLSTALLVLSLFSVFFLLYTSLVAISFLLGLSLLNFTMYTFTDSNGTKISPLKSMTKLLTN